MSSRPILPERDGHSCNRANARCSLFRALDDFWCDPRDAPRLGADLPWVEIPHALFFE